MTAKSAAAAVGSPDTAPTTTRVPGSPDTVKRIVVLAAAGLAAEVPDRLGNEQTRSGQLDAVMVALPEMTDKATLASLPRL